MTHDKMTNSTDLHVLGTMLSQRILEAQARFAAIPKKCDHHVLSSDGCVSTEKLGAHRQGVGFKKDGKEWKLYFVEEGAYEREPTPYEEMEAASYAIARRRLSKKIRDHYNLWQELSQASLVQKSRAVVLLPQLFREMQTEYERRAALVGEALNVLNQLDSELPPAVKEGE